jgi:predicted HTH domain antitoxin
VVVTFTIPDQIERRLQAEIGPDLGQTTKEALAVELYRQEKLSPGQVAELLGISVYQADGLLKQHGVELPYTMEDLDSDVASLRKARSR